MSVPAGRAASEMPHGTRRDFAYSICSRTTARFVASRSVPSYEFITSDGITYSNIEPDHETSAIPVSTGVIGRARWNQCTAGTSPRAIATKLAPFLALIFVPVVDAPWWAAIALLVIGVGSLQFVLEEGNIRDWFESPLIVNLSIGLYHPPIGTTLFITSSIAVAFGLVFLMSHVPALIIR